MTQPIPYAPKTWQDLPGGGTPITAAELNRMERGIRDVGQLPLYRPGGYTSQDPPTRRAAFWCGSGGEPTFTDKNIAFARVPIQIPVGTLRWRIRMSNRDPAGVTTGAGAVTYGPFYIAETFRNLDTGDPISWTGAISQVHAASTSQAAGAPDWVSNWITNPAHQLAVAGRTYTFQYQWNKAAGSTVYCGSGGSWISTTMADVTNTTAGMTYNPYVPFALAIEYEFVGGQKIILALGDSITEGAKHVWNMWGWTNRLSMRLGMPVINAGDFGSFAGDWGVGAATLTQPRWQRLRDAQYDIDHAIMYLGTNETAWGGTLLQIQQGLHGTSNRLQSELGVPPVNIHALTLHPRNIAPGAAETLRAQANDWLRSGSPMFQVHDIARQMNTTPGGGQNGATLIPGLEGAGPDYTHPGPAGQLVIANSIDIGP